jgi:dTDP-4-amino-4,6-dideoxygalactose transaminase
LRFRAIASGAVAAAIRGKAGRMRLTKLLQGRAAAAVVRLTDSGTAALTLALRLALQRRPGRPIALPAFSCYDLVSAGLGAGAPVVFYDLDTRTLGPDMRSLAALAAVEPAAVVLVHAFGMPVDVTAARAVLGTDTMLIEDCAQAWGATLGGVPVGRAGDAAVFSFGRGKGITGGSGGALTLRDDRFAAGLPTMPPSGRGVRDSVACTALWLLSQPEIYAVPARMAVLRLGETRYHPPREVGALTVAAAATLAASIDAVDQAARGRASTANAYHAALDGAAGASTFDVLPGAVPGWLRFPVLAARAADRDRMVAAGRHLGMAASYPKPLPRLWCELTGATDTPPDAFPGADALASRLLTAPTHEFVRESDLQRIVTLLTSS